ncbi:MAG: glutathione S-transferase family protein [Pseudomonadota bacterium]
MAELILYGVPQSNLVWATRIVAAEKGIHHRHESALPHSDTIAAISPLGKIPAMRHGSVGMAESRAIAGYIDSAFDGPSLMPKDPETAALHEQWIMLALTSVDPVLIRQYVFAFIFPGTPDKTPDQARIDSAMPAVEKQLDLLERGVGEGAILQEDFALPDAWVIPMLHYMAILPHWAGLAPSRPHLAKALDRALARPSVTASTPPPLEGA